MKCVGLYLMQRTCLWNTAGTTPFSKDITKEQPFMKVLLFLILTSSSPCTPSQSPTGTSGCIGLNNGLFVWRKFTGNIKLLLRQERLLYGSQERRSQGVKWRTVLLQDRNIHVHSDVWSSTTDTRVLVKYRAASCHGNMGILGTSSPWKKRQGSCGWTLVQRRL